MQREVLSIITSSCAVLAIAFFGYFIFFYKEYKKSLKICSFVFMCIAVFVGIVSFVLQITYGVNNYIYKSELVFNIETIMLMVLVLISVLWMLWLKPYNKPSLTKWQRKTGIAFRCVFYIYNALIIAIWIAIMIIGDVVPWGKSFNISWFIKHYLNFVQYLLLVLWIIGVVAMGLKIAWVVYSNIKINKYDLSEMSASIFEIIGYALTLCVVFMLFLAFRNVDDPHSWIGSQLNSFFTEVYSNDLSYIMIYFAMSSSILISSQYLKRIKI